MPGGPNELRVEKLESLKQLGLPSSADPTVKFGLKGFRTEWEIGALLGISPELVARWRQPVGGAPDDPAGREQLDRAARVADLVMACSLGGNLEAFTPDFCRVQRPGLGGKSICEVIQQDANAPEVVASGTTGCGSRSRHRD